MTVAEPIPMRSMNALRELRSADLAEVAAVHRAAFPGYFLTALGEPFIARLYREYLATSEIALVAEQNGQIVGFILGTSDLSAIYRRFYQRNIVFTARTVATGFLRDPWLRTAVRSRVGHAVTAVRAITRRQAPSGPLPEGELGGPELVSIGILPSAQGSGAAAQLVDALLENMRDSGEKLCNLSVQIVNERAIRFYEREGWERMGVAGDEYRYRYVL